MRSGAGAGGARVAYVRQQSVAIRAIVLADSPHLLHGLWSLTAAGWAGWLGRANGFGVALRRPAPCSQSTQQIYTALQKYMALITSGSASRRPAPSPSLTRDPLRRRRPAAPGKVKSAHQSVRRTQAGMLINVIAAGVYTRSRGTKEMISPFFLPACHIFSCFGALARGTHRAADICRNIRPRQCLSREGSENIRQRQCLSTVPSRIARVELCVTRNSPSAHACIQITQADVTQ